MYMKAGKLILMVAIAIAAQPSAAEIRLTNEQEKKADLLGAVQSPVAFLSTCEMAQSPLSKEDQAGFDQATEDEKLAFQAIRELTQTFCGGMIQAASETALIGSPYTPKGSEPICVDPRMQVPVVYQRMIELAEKEPEILHSDSTTTTTFILYALNTLSSCK